MSRRYTGKTADRMAGRLAWFDSRCPRCDEPIVRQVSQIVQRKGEWVHTSCVSGGDEGAVSAWTALLVVALPLIAALWLLSSVPLSGAIGGP